ncbi:MAG: hypothetical protein HOV94_37200 [Saccharothrix sp.]|nr:hypothetical protein [Saccharothrix sp.]
MLIVIRIAVFALWATAIVPVLRSRRPTGSGRLLRIAVVPRCPPSDLVTAAACGVALERVRTVP